MKMINAYDPATAGELGDGERELIRRRERLLGPAYRLFYARPLHLVRGDGVWLYDADGTAYLDVYNNVASLGHCHPRVVEAIARQAALLNTHTRYLHETVLALAERLLATLPPTLGHVMFTCTGSEANDLALRIARAATGGTGVIVTKLAYHGVTSAVAEFSPSLGDGVPLGRHVRVVPAPDGYRGDPAVGEAFAKNVSAALDDLRAAGVRPAMLILDSIFSSDGVYADPPGFLRAAVDAVHAAGALYVADEVQAGFGRTGTALWGFSRHGVLPDMVSMGKPMGNGHPVAGLAIRPELVREFGTQARYFNTFGGNPVSAAAAMAVLDVIEAEGIPARVAEVGAYLAAGLRRLASGHAAIGDVRGAGLFLGVDLVTDRQGRVPDRDLATRVVNGLRERRVLISASGPGGNVLKIRPPLAFTTDNADLFLARLAETLTACRA